MACQAKSTPLAPAAVAPVAVAPASSPASEVETGECHHPANAPAAGEDCGDTISRGAKLSGAPAVALADLLLKPEPFSGKVITLEGKVRQVCQKKGCWMEIAAVEKGPGVRVNFKDYAFFVPKTASGRHAKIEGEVKVAELSEERAKHYESEGAQVTRGKDGKPREIQLIAVAVELTR